MLGHGAQCTCPILCSWRRKAARWHELGQSICCHAYTHTPTLTLRAGNAIPVNDEAFTGAYSKWSNKPGFRYQQEIFEWVGWQGGSKSDRRHVGGLLRDGVTTRCVDLVIAALRECRREGGVGIMIISLWMGLTAVA